MAVNRRTECNLNKLIDDVLPEEMLLRIFSFLDIGSRGRVAR